MKKYLRYFLEDSVYESTPIELQTPMISKARYAGSDPEQTSEKPDLFLFEPLQYE